MPTKKKTDLVLKNPFSEAFMESWEDWKLFKKEQFRFSYKPRGEQAAIDDLFEISAGNEAFAKAIIKQSKAKGWRGLFELKTSPYGTNKAIPQKPNPTGNVPSGGFGQL
jgi:hypothetical protein